MNVEKSSQLPPCEALHILVTHTVFKQISRAFDESPGTRWQLRPCADQESFVRGGPHLITFFFFLFLVDDGIDDPNTAINGPSSARQRNAI